MFHHIFIQLYKPILEAYFNKISMFLPKKKKKKTLMALPFVTAHKVLHHWRLHMLLKIYYILS